MRRELEQSLDERRSEVARLEERLVAREDLTAKSEAIALEREQAAAQQALALADAEATLRETQARADRELERVGGMTTDEARAQLLSRVG